MIKLANMVQPYAVEDGIREVLASGVFVKGPKVKEFEEKWAERCGMPYAIAVSSGAVALELAIEVIFPPRIPVSVTSVTYKAVHNAIRRMGHSIIFEDNTPEIFAHHLHEQEIIKTPSLEDCSHVHGYKPKGGSAIFSFYPTKILGAIGDAGIIVTSHADHAGKLYDLRNHGHPYGTNARMDEIQAAALLAKLPYLDSFIARRKEIVQMYDEGLGRKTPGEFHYAYCIPGSEEKKQKLLSMGVESAFYYTPEFMALPLHPYLSVTEVKEVINAVNSL